MNISKSIKQDKKYIWHPFTQMKTSKPALPIVKGQGVFLIDEKGNSFIDAISSWWVNIHGHCHDHINQRIKNQSEKLEQVLFAGFTHHPAVKLAEELSKILPKNLSRVFYSDNGSTSVEIALKFSI